MMKDKRRPVARWMLGILILTLSMITGWTSYASRSLVKDRRISLSDAQKMASRAGQGSEIQLPVNDDVLEQLNHFLGTPEGREHFRSALRRMDSYEVALNEAVKEYGTPELLNAIPIVESGYENRPSHHPSKAAGL